MPTEIRLSDTTREAMQALDGGIDAFLTALAVEIRDRFQGQARVVTGAMRASASVITAEGSDYAQNVAAAASLNPEALFAPEAPVGPQEAIVQVPINYATYEEFGEVHRAAHPALVPAIESTVADAEAIARRVFRL